MQKEWSRFKSFERFPIESYARPLRLAQNGFYYQGNGEEAKCAFCGVVNATWEDGEPVNELHARLSRTCPFVSGQETANVPIHAEEPVHQQSITPTPRTPSSSNDRRRSNDNNHLTTAKSNYSTNESNVTQREQKRSNGHNLHDCGTNSRPTQLAEERCYVTEKTKYPQYSSREKRLESLTSWKYSHIVKSQDLCNAGLFFVGQCLFKLFKYKICVIYKNTTT